MTRRIFNQNKDVYLIVGETIVCFRKNCKHQEPTASRSISWLYEMFLTSILAIKKSKKIFESEVEYNKFLKHLIEKIKNDDLI